MPISNRVATPGRSSAGIPAVANACCSGDASVMAAASGPVHRVVDDHAVAVEAAAQEFIGRAPEIEPEAAVVEFAEAVDHRLAVGIEVRRPLAEGEEIAPAVVVQLAHP